MRPSRGLQQIRSGQTKQACRKAAGAAPSALLVGSYTSDPSVPYGGVSRRSPACQCCARLFLRPNSRVHKCSHLAALARMVAEERCCLSFEISAFADYRCEVYVQHFERNGFLEILLLKQRSLQPQQLFEIFHLDSPR